MCGIFCSISPANTGCSGESYCQEISNNFKDSGLCRRGPDYQGFKGTCLSSAWDVMFYSTVLHMRGDLCMQPICHPSTGDILLWNGEIFGGIEIPETSNDGKILLELLASCSDEEQVRDIFAAIQGPYAFVFVKMSKQEVWFGRDIFGRRSLLFSMDCNTKSLYLSSVAVPFSIQTQNQCKWQELSAAGIYRMRMSKGSYAIDCFPWKHSNISTNEELQLNIIQECSIEIKNFYSLNLSLPSVEDLPDSASAEAFLSKALTYLTAECEQLLDKLKMAVYRRVGGHSYYCYKCSTGVKCTTAHVAVMFSGGIDSMMIAYLADQCIPKDQPIDLLNVAFETGSNCSYEVPDRVTGRQALSELSTDRIWNFVEINVTKEELQKFRNERISQLILPLESVLDDSIGCAMWFASRGCGFIQADDGSRTMYTSIARVVLSGLGADEQLGGYSRHRSSFQQRGFQGLLEEIHLDISRISARNLGRDDRVVGDHSKEARFPFLDEEFVSFLNQLPIDRKMDLRLPRGIGEKLILRACALKCGLPCTATLAKRAIQFGSRIAKCENKKEKGSDICNRLKDVTDTVL